MLKSGTMSLQRSFRGKQVITYEALKIFTFYYILHLEYPKIHSLKHWPHQNEHPPIKKNKKNHFDISKVPIMLWIIKYRLIWIKSLCTHSAKCSWDIILRICSKHPLFKKYFNALSIFWSSEYKISAVSFQHTHSQFWVLKLSTCLKSINC